MATVLCVLYDDPVDGYPTSYARDEIPRIERYYDGQTTPTPAQVDFTPGVLLGSVSGELGLRRCLEGRGHRLVVTSDKDGPDSVFERELPDADVVISQPFWPAYLTAERIAKAPKLKLAITAGIGSDHVDLQAAIERGITVAEVTYSNSISVSEHVVMMILALVRNYIPSYQWVVNTARGKICDRDAVVRALESGQLAGYAGDVWFPQPAPNDHPWRTMPHHGMTPHTSGTSLSAQARYAAGTQEILECWFDGRPIRDEYLIVDAGKLAGTGAHSYSAGDATGASDKATRFTT